MAERIDLCPHAERVTFSQPELAPHLQAVELKPLNAFPASGRYEARGVDEIGFTGVAAAIAAAVYHAAGVRELPVRIEHQLQSTVVEA